MTIGYLVRTASVTLDSQGNGSITLGPDTSEYWAPNFVRIGTNSTNKTVSYLGLYQGAIGVQDATTFIDETYLGNGDISSVVAGTIVQRGEAISVSWTGGTPGAVGILTVYGRVAGTLPELASVLGTIPGARFQGSNSVLLAGIDIYYLQGQGFSVPVNSTINSPIFNTYGAQGVLINALSLSPNPAKVTITWLYGPNNAATTGAEFIVAGNSFVPVQFIFPVLGAKAYISVTSPSGTNTNVQIDAVSSRYPGGNPQGTWDRNVLFRTINDPVNANSTNTHLVGRTWIGPARWHVDSGLSSWNALLYVVDLSGTAQLISTMSSGSPLQDVWVELPAAPIRWDFTNRTAASGFGSVWLIGSTISADFH